MPVNPPLPAFDPQAVKLFWEDMPAEAIPEAARGLAGAIAGASPFLRYLMIRDPSFAARCFAEEPEVLLHERLGELAGFASELSQAEVMRALRQVRKRVALLIALADLSGRWTVDQVTAALTDFADTSL